MRLHTLPSCATSSSATFSITTNQFFCTVAMCSKRSGMYARSSAHPLRFHMRLKGWQHVPPMRTCTHGRAAGSRSKTESIVVVPGQLRSATASVSGSDSAIHFARIPAEIAHRRKHSAPTALSPTVSLSGDPSNGRLITGRFTVLGGVKVCGNFFSAARIRFVRTGRLLHSSTVSGSHLAHLRSAPATASHCLVACVSREANGYGFCLLALLSSSATAAGRLSATEASSSRRRVSDFAPPEKRFLSAASVTVGTLVSVVDPGPLA